VFGHCLTLKLKSSRISFAVIPTRRFPSAIRGGGDLRRLAFENGICRAMGSPRGDLAAQPCLQVRLPRKGYNPGTTRRLVLTLNRPSLKFRHIRLAKCSDARYLALLIRHAEDWP
jgi:hypothetical protein